MVDPLKRKEDSKRFGLYKGSCPAPCGHRIPRVWWSVDLAKRVKSSSTEGPPQPMLELRPDVPERTSSCHVAVKGKISHIKRWESHVNLFSGQYKPLGFGDTRQKGNPKREILGLLAKLMMHGNKRDVTWHREFGALFTLPTFDYLWWLKELVWSIILFPTKCHRIYSENSEVQGFRLK